MALKLSG
jgi:hypothetical protein